MKRFILALRHITNLTFVALFVWQTTGVELLMKCINIPATNDSVVSPTMCLESIAGL